VQRFITILSLSLAVSLPAIAEEISLKDGTKIVGHMTAVSTDKIEVETSYGQGTAQPQRRRHHQLPGK
jgi:hypothetical protein